MSNVTNKLEVGPGGLLKVTEQKKSILEDITELQECNYVPYGHETVLQLLPLKEEATIGGIILPASQKGEIKGIVAAVNEHSLLTRGQVVRLDGTMFGKDGPWLDYIEGKPFIQVPNHFIKGVYKGIDLTNKK